EDLRVARASTQVASERMAYLIPIDRARALTQKVLRAHQDARRAKTTLRRVVAVEGILERVTALGTSHETQPFDGRNLASFGLAREGQASEHRPTIELNGAGPAIALVAALLRPD